MHRQRSIPREETKNFQGGSRSPKYVEVLVLQRTTKKYKDLKRTCTTIVLLIKPFVLGQSCHRRHRGLLKLPD